MRLRPMPTRILGTAAAAASVLAAVVLPTNAAAAQQIIAENAPNKIQDSYVVVLKDNG
ncbi:hypothetical protein LWC34_18560 [Kibdelosporangium philippinense]|uniref:Uncharacterized protein n=1 Tax=Kibdelosporangium philippinense TaxID=211113 RepID=A0ABS8ZD78_9PSEU|nr:hypothetical protein [Kibdelosporangium philippinense]MCE7004810.1 hypothetical protein [Kibdelosporangium philippinense]